MTSREVGKIPNYDENEKEKKRRFEIIKIKKKKFDERKVKDERMWCRRGKKN